MSATKQLWVLVGGNGAGKSTFYKHYLAPLRLPFVNADEIARILHPQAPEQYSYQAARVAEQLRRYLLAQGQTFCFETVYSHPSKVDFVAEAKALGYEVIMVVVHVQNPQLNMARVAERVSEGGHAVPEEKVRSRIPRTLKHVGVSLALCDRVQVYDNSSAKHPFVRVFSIRSGVVERHASPLPDWAAQLLTDYAR